jgi:hypothetical protein
MTETSGRYGFDRSAVGSLWRQTLAQIPSLFGRLLYLSSLRGPVDGQYQHHGLSSRYGAEETHRALLESHEETFAAWIGRTIEQQRDDIELYFSSTDADRRTIVLTWLRRPPDVAPLTIRDSELRLFAADFEALLDLLRAEHHIPPTDRED